MNGLAGLSYNSETQVVTRRHPNPAPALTNRTALTQQKTEKQNKKNTNMITITNVIHPRLNVSETLNHGTVAIDSIFHVPVEWLRVTHSSIDARLTFGTKPSMSSIEESSSQQIFRR